MVITFSKTFMANRRYISISIQLNKVNTKFKQFQFDENRILESGIYDCSIPSLSVY